MPELNYEIVRYETSAVAWAALHGRTFKQLCKRNSALGETPAAKKILSLCRSWKAKLESEYTAVLEEFKDLAAGRIANLLNIAQTNSIITTLETIMDSKTLKANFMPEPLFEMLLCIVQYRVWESRIDGEFCTNPSTAKFMPMLLELTEGPIRIQQKGIVETALNATFKEAVKEFCGMMNLNGNFCFFGEWLILFFFVSEVCIWVLYRAEKKYHVLEFTHLRFRIACFFMVVSLCLGGAKISSPN